MNILLIAIFINHFIYAFDWSSTEQTIKSAINQGLFTGAVIGVATNNSTYLLKAFGTVTSKKGLFASIMQVDYRFDIGMITQVIAVNSVLMQLYDSKKLNLTKKVSSVLSEFNNNGKKDITIDNLLEHNSGLPAQYFGLFPATPQALIKNIEHLKLDYAIQSQFRYSELGYILLGLIIEKQKNQSLKQAVSPIFLYSGLRSTSYTPNISKDQIIPGGYLNGICQGIPVNKYAHFLDNVAGNAGIFSTAQNLIHYMQLMLNKGKMPTDLFRVFTQEVINLFTTPSYHKKYNNTFAKGWQTIPQSNASCGKKFSKTSFGLTDNSGSYVYADKQKNITIVFLSNGNYPAQKTTPINFQASLSDIIMTTLGY